MSYLALALAAPLVLAAIALTVYYVRKPKPDDAPSARVKGGGGPGEEK